MDADVEPVDVDSSADEEEMKQAARDHLDATVISYVLVSILRMYSLAVCLCKHMSTLLVLTAIAIRRCICSMPARQVGAPCICAGSWNAGPLVHNWCVGSAAVDVPLRLVGMHLPGMLRAIRPIHMFHQH